MFLPHAPSSVGILRKRLYEDLAASGVFPGTADDAVVIISELFSNALRHAQPLPSGDIRVTWTRLGDAVELAVSDGGASTEPRRTTAPLSSLGGRGLSIVESLADGWGVRHDDAGTTVWATLRLPCVANGRSATAFDPGFHSGLRPGHRGGLGPGLGVGLEPGGGALHGSR